MKVAVLSSHTPSLFWFRVDMMRAFLELGHEVVAIGNESAEEWGRKFEDQGIRYRQANIQRNGTNPLQDLRTIISLKKILKEEMPNAIFTYQAKTVIYGGIAAHQLGISKVYPLIAGVGSVFLSKGIKAKVIQIVLKAEYRLALKHSANVFFQNEDDVAVFTGNKLVDDRKVVMLHGSGVNLDKFQVQPLPKEIAFLCISRLIRDKGVFEYLQAARIVKSKYPKVRFLLVGPYDSNPTALKPEELQSYIDDGSIEYFGEQPDVRPYLAQCSVFVLPSYREGTPKTVLEAMACYKAVITTDAPGCRETVINGKNGYLVPVRDVEALAARMLQLIENPDLVPKMAAEGRKIVEEKFDVKLVNAIISKTMNLQEETVWGTYIKS